MAESGSGVEFISVETLLNSMNEQNDQPTSTAELTELNYNVIDGKLVCPECPLQYTDKDKLVRHVRKIHRGLKPYQCYLCDYSTVNSIMFQEHLYMHQGLKPYKCSHCDYRSVSKKYIKKHELRHCNCDKCGFLAKNIKALSKHKSNDCAVQKFSYACVDCKKNFSNEMTFNTHNGNKSYCDICGENYCSRKESHLRKCHPESYEKPFLFCCKACEWIGTSEMKILLHLIHHPQEISDERIDTSILRKYGILNE